MKKPFLLAWSTLGAFAAVSFLAHSSHLCDGFLPENDLKIPVHKAGILAEGGISEAKFNEVIDKVSAVYNPIFQAKNLRLQVNRKWSDATVNASAQLGSGNIRIVNMYGGLARHQTVTEDGFMLVLCHEIGHHLGGAPKSAGFFGSSWATNEGQSDYYGTLKCMRKVLSLEDNAAYLADKTVDPFADTECRKQFTDETQLNVCLRNSLAGQSLAQLFAALRSSAAPQFNTPDPAVVNRMFDSHPAAQCRLDTYFQGSLCGQADSVDVDDRNMNTGTCNASSPADRGARPRCWFKPAGTTAAFADLL